MHYAIYNTHWNLVEDEAFLSEDDAIKWAKTILPSDDFVYFIAEEDEEEDTANLLCMVFARKVWRAAP